MIYNFTSEESIEGFSNSLFSHSFPICIINLKLRVTGIEKKKSSQFPTFWSQLHVFIHFFKIILSGFLVFTPNMLLIILLINFIKRLFKFSKKLKIKLKCEISKFHNQTTRKILVHFSRLFGADRY